MADDNALAPCRLGTGVLANVYTFTEEGQRFG